MTTLPLNSQPIWPLAVYFFAVVFLVATMIVLSYALGQRHQQRATGEPYEGGIVSTGTSRIRLSANFYLLAMFFVIFDLESVFIFAWAISVREAGWLGYGEALVFIAILIAALIYLWRLGALEWQSGERRKQTRFRRFGSGV